MDISKEKLLWMYERMQLIRTFENRVKVEFGKGKIPGFVHLYAGEEAVAVGICANLTDADYMTSTHRGHGHCVAKGVEPRGMMAELFGKATGTCKGKGGSMHIADMNKGMLGANGIVGGGPPLACGSGLTAKVNKTDQVTICFFGDGASEQGTLHESLNLASIWKLPIKQWRGRELAKAPRYSNVKHTDSTAILKEMRRHTKLLQIRRNTKRNAT